MTKKITFFSFRTLLMGLLSMFICSQITAQCDYSITLSDTWGDGWGGGAPTSVEVFADGVSAGVFTLPFDNTGNTFSGTFMFSVNDGQNITTVWTGGVSNTPDWNSECSYEIFDPLGVSVATHGPDPATGSGITPFTSSCPSCIPATFTLAEGSNNCPTEEFFINVDVTNLGSATAVNITNDGGAAAISNVMSTGNQSVGPFAAGTVVVITVADAADGTCSDNNSITTPAVCPFDIGCGAHSNSPGSAISSGLAPVMDMISVSGTNMALTDLNVGVDLDHTFLGDLEIYLLSPCGARVDLVLEECGVNDDMNVQFGDEHGAYTCGTPTEGLYAPSGSLSDFNNLAFDGDWTLVVADLAGGDDGTLNQWCLIPTLGALPAAPANDDCSAAVDISDNMPEPYNTGGATCDATEIAGCAGAAAEDGVWYKVTTDTDGGDLEIAVAGGAGYEVFSGACGGLTSLGCDGGSYTGLTAATEYLIRVYDTDQLGLVGGGVDDRSADGTITATGTALLPIELVSFTGEAMERSNMLKWITAEEINTNLHVIERSVDGVNDFRKIGETSAAGSSFEDVRYVLEDSSPLILGYYRLKTIDFDGSVQYSNVISVQRKGNMFDVVSTYPVPATKELTVELVTSEDEEVTYTLTDITGKVIMQNTFEAEKGLNKQVIDMANMSNGVYFLTLQNSTTRVIKNIVKN